MRFVTVSRPWREALVGRSARRSASPPHCLAQRTQMSIFRRSLKACTHPYDELSRKSMSGSLSDHPARFPQGLPCTLRTHGSGAVDARTSHGNSQTLPNSNAPSDGSETGVAMALIGHGRLVRRVHQTRIRRTGKRNRAAARFRLVVHARVSPCRLRSRMPGRRRRRCWECLSSFRNQTA